MNKYLIEILKNHSSLILPGIGALMVTNKKTGEIKFNPHLTFNDGALSNFIASAEGIDKTEAQNKVAKFTSEIKLMVDKGETYDIFEFGTIFKDKNGDMAFEMSKRVKSTPPKATESNDKKPTTDPLKAINKPEKNKIIDSVKKTGETAKKTTKKAAQKIEKTIKKSAEKSTEKIADAVKSSAKAASVTSNAAIEKTKDKVDDKIKTVKNTYVPPVKDDKLPEVPKIVAETPGTTSKESENASQKETVVVTAEYVEEKKKRRWWLILLLLLLIGLAIVAYFFKDKIIHFLGWDKTTQIENVNQYPDADGDQIPDFADIDITNGTDADGDGIDDLADLDYTHGEDLDHDGIDDTYAASMVSQEIEEIDPLAMLDEDNNGIPDFADINFTAGIDENNNGIDDQFDAIITLGADNNMDYIDDSLAKIALLTHIKNQMDDEDADGIPDYADTDVTMGTDINKNGIDDAFESIEEDSNGDGLNDSLLMVSAMNTYPRSKAEGNHEIEEEVNGTEEGMQENEDITVDANTKVAITEEEQPEVKPTKENLVPAKNQPKSDYSATGNYHTIGAAFSEKGNAEGYTADMNSKGFKAVIIGRFDGLYLVSLKQYDNLNDAKSDLSNIRNTSSSAWIFKH